MNSKKKWELSWKDDTNNTWIVEYYRDWTELVQQVKILFKLGVEILQPKEMNKEYFISIPMMAFKGDDYEF